MRNHTRGPSHRATGERNLECLELAGREELLLIPNHGGPEDPEPGGERWLLQDHVLHSGSHQSTWPRGRSAWNRVHYRSARVPGKGQQIKQLLAECPPGWGDAGRVFPGGGRGAGPRGGHWPHRCLFLKRGCVFHRPQEEEGETAGEGPRGPHRAATERTSPVSFLSHLSSSWESLLPEPAHPY